MNAPLSKRFAESYRGGGEAPDEAALERCVQLALEAFPDLAIDGETFISYVAARLPKTEAPDKTLTKLALGDLYLACAIDAGEPRAIELFERKFIQRTPVYLTGFSTAAALVDEVRQRLREHLLVADKGAETKLADYAGAGSLDAWVRVTAVRIALNHLRSESRRAKHEEESAPASRPGSVDPELEFVDERVRPVFEAAFKSALAALEPRARTLLRLHFFEGTRIGQLATAYNVHRVTVGRWIAEAQEQVLAKTREDLGARLALRPSECDSLIGALRSRFGATVHSALLTK